MGVSKPQATCGGQPWSGGLGPSSAGGRGMEEVHICAALIPPKSKRPLSEA